MQQGAGRRHPDRAEHEVQARHLARCRTRRRTSSPSSRTPGITTRALRVRPGDARPRHDAEGQRAGLRARVDHRRAGVRRPGHRRASSSTRSSGRTRSASRTTPSPSRRAARSRTPPTSRCGPTTSPRSASRRSTTRCTCWPSASRWPGPNLTPQTFEAGMFAYPGGSGPRGAVGLRRGRLHAHRRLPRDLVGPEPHLGAEQQAGRVGAAQRRRPLVARASRRPARPATSRRAEVADLEHGAVSTNGSTPHVDDREAGAGVAADPAGERPPVPRLRAARRRRDPVRPHARAGASVAPGARRRAAGERHDHHDEVAP